MRLTLAERCSCRFPQTRLGPERFASLLSQAGCQAGGRDQRGDRSRSVPPKVRFRDTSPSRAARTTKPSSDYGSNWNMSMNAPDGANTLPSITTGTWNPAPPVSKPSRVEFMELFQSSVLMLVAE